MGHCLSPLGHKGEAWPCYGTYSIINVGTFSNLFPRSLKRTGEIGRRKKKKRKKKRRKKKKKRRKKKNQKKKDIAFEEAKS